jgi:putative phosphoesterase
VLDALSAIAPVEAVYGNVDPLDGLLRPQARVECGGVSIHVSHGHELGSPTPDKLLARYDADVLVYGHTHRALVQREGKRLVVNPGAAGPKRFDVRPSIAILTIANGAADARIVPLSA